METTTVENPGGTVTLQTQRVHVVAHTDIHVDHIDVDVDPHLAGKPICKAEAARKYQVSDVNLSRWASRGIIGTIDGKRLDEGEVALAVAIFQAARDVTGSYVRAGYVLKREMARRKRS